MPNTSADEIELPQLRHALRSAKTGVWEDNFVTGAAYIDPVIKDLLGYGEESFQGGFEEWNRKTLYEPDRAIVEQAFRVHSEGRAPYFEASFRRVHRNGETRWFFVRGKLDKNPDGTPLRLIGTATDISDLKQAQQALRESDERLRQFAEHTTDVIWMIDAASGKVLYANTAIEREWGVPREALLEGGRRWIDLVVPEDQERLARVDLTARDASWTEEFRILRADGQERWMRSFAFPIRRDGQPYRIGGLVTDITQAKADDAKREALVVAQNKTLVREVNHRIKNSLQGVVGLLSLRMSERPDVASYLREAKDQIEAIALVHGLYTRFGEEALDVESMTREITELAKRSGRMTLALRVSLSKAYRCMIAEPHGVAIALILNELLTNAVKHSFPKGNAALSVSLAEQTDRVCWKIQNTGTLPPGFDLQRGIGLGTGLNLARSMLPADVTLELRSDGNQVTAELELLTPTLIRRR